MSILASAIAITWQRNAAYGLRLVEALPAAQFVAQPVAGRVMNHPAWVLAHLNLYAGLAVALCRGEGFADPRDHLYGQKSEPLESAAAYPSKDVMLAQWQETHEAGTSALARVTEAMLLSPTPLERWRAQHPRMGEMLVTLMVKHESGHLGQLSAWRRAMGLPRVAV